MNRISILCAISLGFALSTVVLERPAEAAVGIRVTNGRLVEANGTPLMLRGINHPHTWFSSQTASFANIKAAGANAIRVVLSGGRWQPSNGAADVANVINLCKANRLICVLENHDTTGFGEQGDAFALDAAASYWISVQSALAGQENYVILNIGNEPYGNNNAAAWTAATANAVTRLRNAGFQHTIMVDAPNWGQDWQFVMRDTAATVRAADPSGNLIFSIHMYGVFDTAAEITSYINSFTSRQLALCVCEFGFNHTDGNPDEDTIMSATQAAGIGNMAWSWSGNGGGVEFLDMVLGFNPAQRSAWGTRYITGPNGLSTTSREATIFAGGGGGGGDAVAPTIPGAPLASGVTASSVMLAWSASTDNVGVTGYDIFRATGASSTSFTSVGTSTGTSFTSTGLASSTSYRFQVRARDAAGNVSAFSPAIAVTTSAAPGGGGGCSATYTITNQWDTGFGANITVTNGAAASSSWTVTWTFANGQTVTQMWNGQDAPSGATHSVQNMSFNGSLGVNQSTSFGFNGTWSGTNSIPALTCNRS